MTQKRAVIDALNSLADDASLEEIVEELQIMMAIRRGSADIASGRTKTQQETKQLVKSGTTSYPKSS